jgi:hypothetical protein
LIIDSTDLAFNASVTSCVEVAGQVAGDALITRKIGFLLGTDADGCVGVGDRTI